ncbi:WxL domain-containing protein [Enterococcus sp. LJL90]
MKLRRLSAAALVAVIGAGLVLPAAASASTTTPAHSGTGDVTITGGTIDPTDPDNPEVPDPEIPGVIDPVDPITPNPTPGDLGIKWVSALKFGSIAANERSIRKEAASVAVNQTAPDGTVTLTERGHLVQFEDARGGRDGYTISATLSQQFTYVNTDGTLDTSELLNGSTISYTNGIVDNPNTTSGANGVTPPQSMLTAFNLEYGVSQNVVSAAGTEGRGEFTLEYGQSTDYGIAESTAGNSVFLNIQDGTASQMLAGNYAAVITWTITSGPTTLVTP